MRWIVLLLLMISPFGLVSQSFDSGLQTGISYEWVQFGGDGKISVTPFVHMFRSDAPGNDQWELRLPKIECDVAYKRQIGARWSGGIKYQWKGNYPLDNISSTHTFSQYASLPGGFELWQLTHRFRMDERILPGGSWIFRPRYRMSLKRPVGGQNPDERNWYFIVREELISILGSREAQLENRLDTAFGRPTKTGNNWEIGLQYRLKNFLENATHRVYITFEYSIK